MKLRKIDITSSGGAGRVVFLVIIDQNKVVLLMIRHKNDKKIGQNITIKNPHFSRVLEKNLDLVLGDIAQNAYKEYDLV
jgi:phage-related protein